MGLQLAERLPGDGVVGRESERAVLGEFLASENGPDSLVIAGDPGIGKTTLWETGLEAARERRYRILSARASEPEVQLAFVALADLLSGIDVGDLAGVPSPQRRALEVALLRADPGDAPPESFAVGAGFTSTLQTLAEREPTLVAVDDVPWLDRSSADALAFAARRLAGHQVRFLLARRPGQPSLLEQSFQRTNLMRLELGPLSLGATRLLLSERLHLRLPRRVLRQLFEASQGNPLFALELGRTLTEGGMPEIGAELPMPDLVDDLFGPRVLGLSEPLRRALLALALSGELSRSQLERLADPGVVEDAAAAGLVVLDGERVRASHPLLAAAAKRHSNLHTRRALHAELAPLVADEGLRTRHLILAARDLDEELAAAAERAAASAAARGAAHEAVELGEGALRLTPLASTQRVDRLLALASHLAVAGEYRRLTDLLAPALDSLPAGAPRVSAWLYLTSAVRDDSEVQRYLERALEEAGHDPRLRAAVLGELANNAVGARVERIPEAEQWALEAVASAADPDVERTALHGLAWAQALRGRPIDSLCKRSRGASPSAALLTHVPERVDAQRLIWRGELDRARVAVTGMIALADEHGQAVSHALWRLHLCELELRSGAWDAAADLLDDWADAFERELLPWPMYERCRALTAAGRGSIDEAVRWAADAISRAEETDVAWDRLEAQRARGIAAIVAGEPELAVVYLHAVWEHTCREGVDEPGVFPVAPDLVEALVELGDLIEARSVTERLERLGREQEHPWGLTSAKRCEALIGLASGYDEQAAELLSDAARAYAALGLRFDQARCWLLLGRAQRRFKKWAAARGSLEQAVVLFEQIGSPGWSDQSRGELARVGARRPAPEGSLTETEERVAGLAASGLSNKEIAGRLFVSVSTVEKHLSSAYTKLHVRSRTQLAQRLASPSDLLKER